MKRLWSGEVCGLFCQHVSNEKNLGCLVCIKDDTIPSYVGIIICHDKDPY